VSFDQLFHVAKLAPFPHNQLVFEWKDKREHLLIYSDDVPRLVEEYKQAGRKPYPRNPLITFVDPVPKIRLSSACEASVNCLYGMAEIAARFANRLSQDFPSSFNALRKKAERGDLEKSCSGEWVSDFGWYKKVRELRTEWAHYSTIFIGEDERHEPTMVVRNRRNVADRVEFPKQTNIPVADLPGWITKAVAALDNFGNHLLEKHILPTLDVDAVVTGPKLDELGWPIIRPDHTMVIEKIRVSDYVAQCGVSLGPK
jgi:hypothetical protein